MAAIAAGVFAAHFVRFDGPELLSAGIAFALLTVIALKVQARILAITCGCLLLTCIGARVAETQRLGSAPQLNAESGETLILAGCVVEPSAFSDDREQFTLELAPHSRARVSVTLRENESPPVLRYGQKIEAEVKVRFPRNFGNPGAFDYVGYLARQDIHWLASASNAASIAV